MSTRVGGYEEILPKIQIIQRSRWDTMLFEEDTSTAPSNGYKTGSSFRRTAPIKEMFVPRFEGRFDEARSPFAEREFMRVMPRFVPASSR
jgi:hypothetical protein